MHTKYQSAHQKIRKIEAYRRKYTLFRCLFACNYSNLPLFPASSTSRTIDIPAQNLPLFPAFYKLAKRCALLLLFNLRLL